MKGVIFFSASPASSHSIPGPPSAPLSQAVGTPPVGLPSDALLLNSAQQWVGVWIKGRTQQSLKTLLLTSWVIFSFLP